MDSNHHYHYYLHIDKDLGKLLETVIQAGLLGINKKLDTIIMKQSEALALLATAREDLNEGMTEVLAELENLKKTDPDISPEGMETVNGLISKAKAFKDLIPQVEPPV